MRAWVSTTGRPMWGGFRNPGNCWLWNAESWALESGLQLKESGNPLTIGIRNPCSTERKLALFRTKDNVLLILLPPAPPQLIYFSFSIFYFFFIFIFPPDHIDPTLNSYFNTASWTEELYITTTTITTTFLLFPSFSSSFLLFSLLLMHVLFPAAVIVKVPVHWFRRANRA